MYIVVIVAFLVFWFTAGIFAWGLNLAYYTNNYPAFSHRGLILLAMLGGVVSLFAIFVLGQCTYPPRFRPYTKEQCWEAHQRLWPSLSRENFERTY